MAIKKVYVLVHPLYHLGSELNIYSQLPATEATVSEDWYRIALRASKKDDVLFIVFNGFELEKGKKLLESYGDDVPPGLEQLADNINLEENRRTLFLEALSDKLIEIDNPDYKEVHQLDWESILSGIELAPEVEVLAFGEYIEACVDIWGTGFAAELVKRGVIVDFKMPDYISLGTYEVVKEDNELYEKLGV